MAITFVIRRKPSKLCGRWRFPEPWVQVEPDLAGCVGWTWRARQAGVPSVHAPAGWDWRLDWGVCVLEATAFTEERPHSRFPIMAGKFLDHWVSWRERRSSLHVNLEMRDQKAWALVRHLSLLWHLACLSSSVKPQVIYTKRQIWSVTARWIWISKTLGT